MVAEPSKVAASGKTAIIHTTKGDIVRLQLDSLRGILLKTDYPQYFRLHPEYAPKAVENFVEHSKNGYYNGIIFHRIIKKFVSLCDKDRHHRAMIDTRCPPDATNW